MLMHEYMWIYICIYMYITLASFLSSTPTSTRPHPSWTSTKGCFPPDILKHTQEVTIPSMNDDKVSICHITQETCFLWRMHVAACKAGKCVQGRRERCVRLQCVLSQCVGEHGAKRVIYTHLNTYIFANTHTYIHSDCKRRSLITHTNKSHYLNERVMSHIWEVMSRCAD